jgi:hypothetical protein
MKATIIYKGIALIGATSLIIAASNAIFEEDHKQLDKEDSKYHLSQDDNHKQPVKLKLGEILSLRQRSFLKRKWEYGFIKLSSPAMRH